MYIKDYFNLGKTVVSCEIFPPKKDVDIENIYAAAGNIAALNPDFISVTYGAGGTGNRNHTAEIAEFIQSQNDVPVLAHLTCIGADKQQIEDILDGMQKKGIENTLILRGDLPKDSGADGFFRYAEELIGEVHERGDFCIAGACYPEGHIECFDADKDLYYLRKKEEAGADFFIGQLFFDNDLFLRFLEKAGKAGVKIPISAGIMPFLGRSQIERMIFMCGASLPSNIVKLLHKYENSPHDLREAGLEYAAKQIEDLIQNGVQGIHIYTMNKPDIAHYCMKHIGRI